jgi:hypothetical protein
LELGIWSLGFDTLLDQPASDRLRHTNDTLAATRHDAGRGPASPEWLIRI